MRIKNLLLAAVSASLLLAGGCVYRIDIPQGNFIEQKQIDRLRVGMSREQVEYVMGSPMTQDGFNKDTWYYIYYLKPGWEEAERKELKLHFTHDKLDAISGDYPPPAAFHTQL